MKQCIILAAIMSAVCSLSFANDLNSGATGVKFPSFSANNLNDSLITVPDSVSPKVEVAVITFARQDLAMTDSWVNTLNALYAGNTAVTYSQTAVIGDIPVIGGFILNGMKGSLPKDKWERFLIYTGDKEKLSKTFSVDNAALFYVYVIGKDGLIKWMVKSAKTSDAEITALLDAVKKELYPAAKKSAKNKK